MVLGVCRRVLNNESDAEDAFQATFLVLVRKAGSVVPRSLVGNFLYGVAHNTARKAKTMRGKRRARELGTAEATQVEQSTEGSMHLQALLEEELGCLPENYRTVIVLCELEGRTIREAARHLGWPQGTVAGRLARARALLAKRLARRGVSLSGGALVAVLARQTASACVPRLLAVSTMKAAAVYASTSMATAAISARVAVLTEGVLKTMLLNKLKVAVTVLLLATLAIVGLGYLDGPRAAARQEKNEKPRTEKPAEKKPAPRPAATWPVRATLKGHEDGVYSVAFSRDGRLLATASHDGTVRLWNVMTGKCLATLSGHEGKLHQVAFAPDGMRVATAGEDKTARVWDVEKGVEIQKVVHTDPVRIVAFMPDGKTLIAGGGVYDSTTKAGRGELRLWDAETGKERAPLNQIPSAGIHDFIMSKDGKVLITASGNVFTIWDFDGKYQLKERCSAQAEESAFVYGMALSPDGKTLAVTWDAKVFLYSVATGKQLIMLEKSYVNCWGPLIWSPDGRTVAAGMFLEDREGGWIVQKRSMIRTWDAKTGRYRETIFSKGTLASMAIAPDGKTVAIGLRGGVRFPDEDTINASRIEEQGKDGTVQLLSVR
jgi:RNA polymerase sigma factor (sigma-70 family)